MACCRGNKPSLRGLLAPLLALGLALAALAAGAPPVTAQAQPAASATAPDYAAWERLALRAEEVVEAGRAATDALEELRAQLAEWRLRLQAAQGVNAPRIRTLQEQLAALAAPPEAGVDPVAERRAELERQLAELRAPVLRAEEAFRRADGLIREIDGIIAARKAARLLELGPSPFEPARWPGAAQAVVALSGQVAAEIRGNWQNSVLRAERAQRLPMILLLSVLAVVLLGRGRRWLLWTVDRIAPSGRTKTRHEIRWLLTSVSGLVVPMLGLWALVQAVEATALLGPRGQAFLAAVPMMGLLFFGARWLAAVIFNTSDKAPDFCNLGAAQLAAARRAAMAIVAMLPLAVLLRVAVNQPGISGDARLVLGFPIFLVMGLALFRLGRLLRLDVSGASEDETTPLRDRVVFLLSRGMMMVGIAGPALAAVGYFNAGGFFLFPSVMSVGLMALLVILQRLANNLYALAVGADDDKGTQDALIPVLIGLGLMLASVPFFALIWGVRPSQLQDAWVLLRDGFSIGATRISFAEMMTFVLVFAAGYMLTRLVQGALRNSILPKTRMDVGGREAIVTGTAYVGIFLAAVVAITTAGIDLSSLAIVAGALSVGIGFGLQTVVSNFVSGIILLIERPIKKGDWIEVGGVHGYVRDISVRATRIETFDRSDVIVPNADLIAGRVTNFTHGNTTGRAIVPVGVAYGTDTRKVEAVLREIVEAHPMVIVRPPPAVLMTGFGADSLNFEIRAILRDVNWSISVKSDLLHEIARRFAEEGIEIPFAQRDIWLRNPEALGGAFAPPGAPRPPSPQVDPALRDAEDAPDAEAPPPGEEGADR
ncbi:MAG: DUF3772 domain-containing protein [Alphaproteobacteria bacterium HGW-Alphaproteobacteria-2]|nr:MAG: DUF3772 domain-containing protein [Alphaproteobacteria bacterium HGW-Alphaproteobacteria-2]